MHSDVVLALGVETLLARCLGLCSIATSLEEETETGYTVGSGGFSQLNQLYTLRRIEMNRDSSVFSRLSSFEQIVYAARGTVDACCEFCIMHVRGTLSSQPAATGEFECTGDDKTNEDGSQHLLP